MRFDPHQPDGRLGQRVFSLHGTFDDEAADHLLEALEQLDAAAAVAIDLHDVRQVHDFAMVRLARALRGRRAVVLGISEHHVRLLSYLGIPICTRPDRSALRSTAQEAVPPLPSEASHA